MSGPWNVSRAWRVYRLCVVVVVVVVVQDVAGQARTPPTLPDTRFPPDEGPEGNVAGVSLGPGSSLLCSPPLDATMMKPVPTPITVCAFVRVNQTHQASRLLTLTTPASTLTVGKL